MDRRQPARGYDQSAVWRARKYRDGLLDLLGDANVDWAYVYPDRWRGGLNDGELADPGRQIGIAKHRRPRHIGRDLLEQLQPFRAQLVFELHEAGCVAAGPRQAVDEATTDRVGDIHEHDRHGGRRLHQLRQARSAGGEDDVRRERDQFQPVSAKEFGIARAPTILDPHVAADGPTQLLQAL